MPIPPSPSDDSKTTPHSEGEALQVLLVEDNPGDARLFEEYLGESSTEAALRHEETLQGGLDALNEAPPDVLVVDLGLPDSEGTETVRAAAAAAPEVPIVVLTGQEDLQAALEAQEAGAAEYLQKEELTPALVGRTLRWAVQRHRMQAKLRERDAWIRSITEGLSAGVFRAGPAGRIEYANAALAEMLGFERAEGLIGLDLTTFCADPAKTGRMLAEDGASDMEVEFEAQEGASFVGLLNVRVACGPNGTPIHYDGVVTDITERARRKERLRMLSEAVEQAKESVVITEAAPLEEPGPQIEYVNSAYEEMTGYAEGEILGKTPRVLQGPGTEREVLDSLQEALEAGKEWEGETVNYRKDGEPYRVQWNVSPVRNGDGSIEHWVSTQRDVTEERAREDALRRSRELYRSLFEDSTDAILVHDLEGRIQEANPQAESLFGREAGELEGQSIRDLHVPEEQETTQEKLAALRAGEAYQAVSRYERAGESTFWGEVSAHATDLGDETIVRSLIRDVTERKEAEEELQSTKNFYEQILNEAPIDLAVFSPEAEFEYLNPESVGDPEMREWLLGRTNEDYCRKRGLDLELGQQRDRSIRTSAQEKETDRFEETIETDGGHRHYLRMHSPVTDLEGAVTHVVAFGLDITERKRREEALARQNDLFERAQQIADVGAWEYDVQNEEGTLTDQAYRIHGLTPGSDMTPEKSLGFFHAEDRPTIRRAFNRAVEEGTPYDVEVRLITEGGDKQWIRTRGEPLREEGEVVRVRGTIQDITERKERERELETLTTRLQLALESTNTGVFDWDLTTGDVIWDETSERLFGFEPGGFSGYDSWVARLHPDDLGPTEEEIEDAIENERTFDAEYRVTPPEGEQRWIRARGNIEYDEDGTATRMIGIHTDVTDRKRRERELIEAKEEAERMNRLKSAFLANMSHEIRTPLTSILGFAEMIGETVECAQETGEVDLSTLAEFSSLIERSGHRLMDTLTGVLNLSKLQAGEMTLDLGPVDLATEAEETAEEFGPQAREAGIDLKTEAGGDPVWARADAGGLQIALRNLLSNAIKYTESGGTVWVRVRQAGGMAVLEVEDTGIGMDPETAEGLFEAFKQASEGIGREYEGTGLGLTVTKEVLDRMGGSIEVETETGEGSRFTVRLPRPETSGEA